MSPWEGYTWQRRTTCNQMDEQKTHLITANTANTNNKIKKMIKSQNDAEGKSFRLLRFEELPEYMKDNEHILNYYRANWPIKQAFFSVFQWHNETLNIWTHLIGFVLFVGLTYANLMHASRVPKLINILSWSSPSSSDVNVSNNLKSYSKTLDIKVTPPATLWPFFVFLSGSMFCLLSSSICHLFCCHSHPLNTLLIRIDYIGIVVMIIASFFPPIYYIFQCSPHWQLIYLGGITIIGIFTVAALLSRVMSTNKYRSFRALVFGTMGGFGLVPGVHAMIVNWSEPYINETLAFEVAMFFSYVIGTVVYVFRIPERWRPGWFDLAGQSHQIFHVFVVIAALAHYNASLVFLDFKGKVDCVI